VRARYAAYSDEKDGARRREKKRWQDLLRGAAAMLRELDAPRSDTDRRAARVDTAARLSYALYRCYHACFNHADAAA